MAHKIRENFSELCKKTIVGELLIAALYSKGVTDNEFKEVLVRFGFIKTQYSICKFILFLMAFPLAIPQMEYPEIFQAL
jgi:hypothetical protein